MTDQPTPPHDPSKQENCPTGACPLQKGLFNWRTLVLLALVAFVLLGWWPILKGLWYSGSPSPENDIPWQTNYQTALQQAEEAGKPALLVFSASWCPPCKVMKHEVWPDEEVTQLASASYVPVYLDADLQASQATYDRYGVQVIPTIIAVDAEGRELNRANFLDRDEMVAFLRQIRLEQAAPETATAGS